LIVSASASPVAAAAAAVGVAAVSVAAVAVAAVLACKCCCYCFCCCSGHSFAVGLIKLSFASPFKVLNFVLLTLAKRDNSLKLCFVICQQALDVDVAMAVPAMLRSVLFKEQKYQRT